MMLELMPIRLMIWQGWACHAVQARRTDGVYTSGEAHAQVVQLASESTHALVRLHDEQRLVLSLADTE